MKWTFRIGVFAFAFLQFSCSSALHSAKPGANPYEPRFAVTADPVSRTLTEARGGRWAISTQGRAATDAAAKVFAEGGNIIDAAVAASFTISVERPQSTGIGGGGFMLYRVTKSGETFAIDFRERAPIRAHERMFLNPDGSVMRNKSLVGIQASGVPGLVAGLSEIH
ncbi:MAG: gamma-glutamyltransferase [Cryobacterium sp.]|nr:gamma-glutamyltransferase [Oligoflexia bacterium]